MDDDNAIEPEPTSSKKTCQKTASAHNVHYDEHGTNSDSLSLAGSSSVESKLNMARFRTDKPKPPITKGRIQRESKRKDGRNKSRQDKRLRGRVQKTKRSQVRRAQKRSKTNRRRAQSVSTISSRLTAGSPRRGRSPTCKYCGHRSCYRRTKRVRFKRIRKSEKQKKERKRMPPSECIQAGSRCVMLSPLLVKTNLIIAPETTKEDKSYAEITPEMIYESLRRLTMWRESVETNVIMDYIKRNYPVDPDSNRVLDELRDKLRIAVLTGIVTQKSENMWSLSSALEKRQLTSNHVTLFWKLYGDTMRPVTKKTSMVINPESKHAETSLEQPFDHFYS